MVTASALVSEAVRRGARFRVLGDRLEAEPARVFDSCLARQIGTRKREIIEEVRRREALLEAEAVAMAQRLLRDCRFPLEAAPCVYHCGNPEECCRRCGAPLSEHY
jgi:hypothetical protein